MLHFIPTPIGNLEDISARSLKLLASAKIVFCEDTRVSKKLLSLLKERNPHLNFTEKEYISMHSHNETKVLKELDRSIFEKESVYLSDAGMPCISDPGCKFVEYLQKNRIDYEVLPGANAALLAYASSGFCDKRFLFFGFLPHKGKERRDELIKAINSGFVTIIYESPHRISKLIDELCDLIPDRSIFLIKEATKLHETKLKATTKEIKQNFHTINQKGEWVVVIDAKSSNLGTITVDDILALNLPKKEASKLIAKITRRSPKECYNQLLKSK